MVNLEPEDRKQLIAALRDVDELKNESSRLLMLNNAGLEKVATNIDLSGAPFVAISQIVSYLSNYGRLSYDREALGQFLNSLLEYGVLGIEKEEFVSQLINKYEMMEPVVTAPKIGDWLGKETPVSVQEKIIGENTLRPIAFLAEGVKVSKSVVYIGVRTVNGKSSGTGFMVAPNLLLTNNHVLPYAELVQNALFRFNYEENFLGEAQAISEYRGKAGGIFHTNINLDYSLVEIEGEPGKEWGYLPLAARDVKRNSCVNIIQHPMGRPKEISMQSNFVQYVDKNVVQYITSTQPGSSGSPVFNDNWEVVALHHAGGNISEPATGKTYFRNEGTYIGSILKDLPEELKGMLVN
jgi:V8-like Glu-specific endopeptidase